MFDTVLIANRGEIACRVIRTCRALGVRTVAVYSDADARALHVTSADVAIRVGPAEASSSYLDQQAILDAARSTGAQAIHPGYGFLAENADFAEACAAAGVVFIGPLAAAMRAMGSKREAKAMMAAAGVPVVPGYHGADQSDDALQSAAADVGYPLLIKASAGGGGKGMRRVDAADAFVDALGAARREAASAFGDDSVLLERYVERPRHVEVQVFGDSHGNAIHLWERECSVQRRYQKVIEEAPSPALDDEARQAMGQAAVAAARAVEYVGAGTVEFLLSADGAFYFLEMNTRLQVEHPVTEIITGTDLVAWQLHVAAGDPLPIEQDEVRRCGHAIEVRLYAEDADRGFLPATGTLARLAWPAGEAVRVDTGIAPGDAVGIHYDPMLAKIIAGGETREQARRRLVAALRDTRVAGITTNRAFLLRVLSHPAFAAAEIDTGFIDRHIDDLAPPARPAPQHALRLAALHRVLIERAMVADGTPWGSLGPWRANHQVSRTMRFEEDASDAPRDVVVRHAGGAHYTLDDLACEGALGCECFALSATIGGVRHTAEIVGDQLSVDGEDYVLRYVDPLAVDPDAAAAGGGRLTAPMPGKLIAVHVAEGDAVQAGAALVTIEAMKMEQTLVAPADGVVASVPFAAGDQVDEGAVLVEMRTDD